MQRKINFLNMEHSAPLELHISQKLDKLQELLRNEEKPQIVEVNLRAGHIHAHHEIEIHLKTKNFTISSRIHEGPDMYLVFNNAFDIITKLLTKEKEKLRDKHQKLDTEKKNFKK